MTQNKRLVKNVQLNRSTAGKVVIFIFLFIFSAFMVLPLIFLIMNAFKPLDELFAFPPRFYVKKPTFKNFLDLFAMLEDSFVPTSRYFFNSVFVTVVTTILHVVLSSMAAFPLAKHKFKYRNFIFKVIEFSLLFNGFVLIIPKFIIMSNLNMLDKYSSLVLPMVGTTLGLYLMKQFMEQVPDSVLEAARIDGASEFKTLWWIVMPMVKPAWLTLVLFVVRDTWGDAYSPSMFIHNESMKTLPVLGPYVASGGLIRAGASAAFGVFMIILPISIFIFSQANVIETMKTSGMKD